MDGSSQYNAQSAGGGFDAQDLQRQLHDADEVLRGTAFRVLLIRGILAIILGIVVLLAPVFSAAVMTMFIAISIAVWLLLDGIGSISIALKKRKIPGAGWGWTLAAGIIAILAAIGIVIFPFAFTAAAGLLVFWTLAIGLVFQGITMFADARLGGWGIVLGIINVLFGIAMGVMLFINPVAMMVALFWIAGIYALVFGIGAIIMAFRVRKA